ncbi:MAG: P44/Msp2 family outer membrane protein [Ehrlichia sp.]
MSYKKIAFWVILFFVPSVLSAHELNDGIFKSFYFGIQYKPARHYLSSLIVKESSDNTVGVFALKKDASGSGIAPIAAGANFNVKYHPHYENNNTGFSGILGYYCNNNFRVESEVSYEIFRLKNDGYKIAGLGKHLALARELDDSAYYPKQKNYVTMMNDGIGVASVLINACYDGIGINRNGVVIYSCLGFGADIVDFLGRYSTKLSYQGKLGASYSVSPKVVLFAEGYYHGLFGKTFSNIPVDYPCDDSANKARTTASAMLSIRYYGGGVGVRFIL